MTNYDSNRTGNAHDNDESRISTLENNIATLTTNLSTASNQITTLQNNISTLTGQISTLSTNLNNLNTALDNLNSATNTRLHLSTSNTIVVIPTTISTTNSSGMLTVLGYIRDHYPNYVNSWFVGTYSQSGTGWYFIMVYNTSDLHTDGYPRYAWGLAGMVNNYKAVYRHISSNPTHVWA